ncbi:SpoIIE family protein phosphatase [Solirubrobacter sp. CPCC 204708]|uniref:SpoIIE family protein phosphatase n=1 Tax=Solirubrobacter deserti TaxID=2282478 RepID=A0ABT4RIK8_9ACTN|nr:SpoIIE family protein phosphatase [Solirubrobacter deserti]MBE2320301.1 SpoIIE family protein phosphatase [Solirubrobacter deserti]MDA0138313.1 SpoIIE family protein phosphatase [Solirubrobacter deserti]
MGPDDGTNGASALTARYSAAFSAYLADGSESALGVAYDLGREAVAAQLSVLDLAEAHHAALRAANVHDEKGLLASADFLRESLSMFETVHRGYLEVQEVARLEHEYVEQLRALADASVAINLSLTVEAILQLTADAARGILRSARATVAVLAPDPRLRPLTATSPPRLGGGEPQPARLSAQLTGRGKELGMVEVIDSHEREFTARDEAVLTQLAQLTSVAISNAQLYERERTIARTLQRSLRPGGLPPVPGLSAAVRFRPAGEGIELGGDFYDLFGAGDGAWTALIGDVQGKGPDAAAVTALARHTMRAAAAYESRPSGVLALLHRALRDQTGDEGRFCTVCYAHLRVNGRTVNLELACGGHPLPLVVAPDGSVTPVGRLGTLLGSDIDPLLTDVSVELAPGEVLVFYTDGVTEVRRRRQEVFGHGELVALLRTCAGLPPDAVADRVEAAVITASDGRLRDDMAILAFGPTPQPKENDG